MKLNSTDNNRILEFYREAFEQYGRADARSVRWSSQKDQFTRFRVLLQIDNLEGKRVLDVGCGLGDLYKSILQHEIDLDYSGIDIVPEFIEAARERFPDATFETKDIFQVTDRYDFVLASGSLSFKVEDNATFYKEFIKKMYEVAEVGVAFNMLDRDTHIDNEIYAAYSIEEIADFCESFAGGVEIVTGYLLQDFTVYLFK